MKRFTTRGPAIRRGVFVDVWRKKGVASRKKSKWSVSKLRENIGKKEWTESVYRKCAGEGKRRKEGD